MQVTTATNFLRVFQLPDELPSDYCFGGPVPTTMEMVDWFNAVDPTSLWDKDSVEDDVHRIKSDIKGKRYFNPNHTFLVITDYGEVFFINPELRPKRLQAKYDEGRIEQTIEGYIERVKKITEEL